ncbi:MULTISPECIES: RING finger protein [unclassified Endozoicomonas]|uniref:RING finger protein n=1 Tax=unclassified Endozoicomonas TaxID=2644528 RepID=UPI003BB5A34F
MTMLCALRILLFLVFLFFFQQSLANDTYNLEEYRHHKKTNGKQPSEKQQNSTGQPAMKPLENMRLGFVGLNLASDDVSGDERLEIFENYEVAEQDFKRLESFYFDYVNMGEPQRRKVRIQSVLRLIHRIFAININRFTVQSRAEQMSINAMAKSLFDQLFMSVNINGRSNPYLNYFYIFLDEHSSSYADVDNGLALMFFAFLGPQFLSKNDLYTGIRIMQNIYTGVSCNQAFDCALLSENIDEYHSPESLASQLNAAGLDAGTALLIGLTTMASAAFQRMNSGLELLQTLETVLIRCLPFELLSIVYSNIARHCRSGNSRPEPALMYSVYGMQIFTHSIVGINPVPLSEAASLESLEFLVDYHELSDSDSSLEESDFEDQSIVVQQQNELIGQLRQELASQSATEEAGAVGGASAETKKCPLCTDRLTDLVALHSCGHAGFCRNCAERLIREERECPFCRNVPLSCMKILDMSLP